MKNIILFAILVCLFADFQVFSQANANQFKWVDGANITNQASSYGASSNNPGARTGSSMVEYNGKLYLFGGIGYFANQGSGYLNDLWEFNPSTNNWTLLKSSDTINSNGSNGTKGVPAASNLPPSREYAALWALNGKLYLFGGYQDGLLYNNLYEYDISTNNWTWIKGDPAGSGDGIYGTINVAAPNNTPGSRLEANTWTYNNKLYLFGGQGYGSVFTAGVGYLNDLWEYDPSTNNWKWIKGVNTTYNAGSFGTIGVAQSSNLPPSRSGSISIENAGKLYLFGGSRAAGIGNDLWVFDLATNNWTWLKGASATNQGNVFGSQGIASASNLPSSNLDATFSTTNGKLYLFGGHGFDSSGQLTALSTLWEYNPATNNWTWLKGPTLGTQTGTYGQLNIANSTNIPSSRFQTTSATIAGKLYLFGGSRILNVINNTTELLNDLWVYDPMTNNFTWIKGRNIGNSEGAYNSPFRPGARKFASTWSYNNKLYLMGGYGLDENGTAGTMNDLWEYNPTTSLWAWLKGGKFVGSSGSYGTIGVSSATNLPTPRERCTTWTYNNKLYLLGGYFNTVSLADLWVYEPTTNNWTWIKGPSTANNVGVYGTIGIENTANYPGARTDATSWVGNNKLYLMGGYGYGSSTTGFLNDVWAYNPSTNNWAWDNGSNIPGSSSVISGSPSVIKPGARQSSVTWVDDNVVYLMGGLGTDISINGNSGFLNDLWRYNLTTRLWTFLKGSVTLGQPGVYGSQGVANNANKPGGRLLAISWIYNKKLYLFGGSGLASTTTSGFLNDLWEYKPSTNNWTWLKGSFATDQGGNYGTQGAYSTNNIAGGREAPHSFIANNKLYIFGGAGYGSGIGVGLLNDLWEYTPACTEVYSVASGDWNTTSTWSCNQVPITTDVVNIYGHTVNLIGNGFAKNVIYNQNGNIQFSTTGKLFLNQ